MTVLESERVPVRHIVAVEVEGDEYVVWRGASGALGSAPRRCPHLDWDLTEGQVVGDELVCTGHGWSFTCAGRALKRNELGREDDKGTIECLVVAEVDGTIELIDYKGSAIATYSFKQGWPLKYTGASLNASGNEVALEELQICHEGMERM